MGSGLTFIKRVTLCKIKKKHDKFYDHRKFREVIHSRKIEKYRLIGNVCIMITVNCCDTNSIKCMTVSVESDQLTNNSKCR